MQDSTPKNGDIKTRRHFCLRKKPLLKGLETTGLKRHIEGLVQHALLDELRSMMLEACFRFRDPIFGAQISCIHYTMRRMQSHLVFTARKRRKIHVDGFVQHNLPLAQAVNKHAFDNEVRFACQACQGLAGLSQKALQFP